MLLNLTIKNYALIDELRLEFSDGLVIFSGETGAGKSIIIESIGLLLGERASAMVVRKGAERCSIAGEFDLDGLTDLKRFLKDAALADGGDDTLIIRREIDAAGKSRAFINDQPVSIATLQGTGELLVDVHGQHEHQSLLKNSFQRDLIDRFAGNEKLLDEIAEVYRSWRDLITQRDAQKMSEAERERLIDLYRFQVNEIDHAKLCPGDEEEIERALPQVKNAEKLRELSDEAYQALYGDDGAVLERLSRVQKLLETINNLTPSLSEPVSSLKSACFQLDDVARELENFRDNLSADPEKLNELLSKQDQIHRLKKKYGATIQDILAYRDKAAADLAAFSNADQTLAELEKNIAKTFDKLSALCEKLSAARRKAGATLAKGIEKELHDLGMQKARFEVKVEKEAEPSSHGWDKIEFLFSANPGQDPQALKAIASGGEMSRVMLALKTVLSRADRVPVLIFDEIDAGIGGPMGQVVGKKLKNLAGHHQILCITHLPQIAAFGSEHFFVEKEIKSNTTFTRVRQLTEKDHQEEVARMLSGAEITPLARKHARELIDSSK